MTDQMTPVDTNTIPDAIKESILHMMEMLHDALQADEVMLVFQGPDVRGVMGSMSLPAAQAMIDMAIARDAQRKGDIN